LAQAPEEDVVQRIAGEAERLVSLIPEGEEQNKWLSAFVPVFAEADPERLLADAEAVAIEGLRERASIAALATLAAREPERLAARLDERPPEIAHPVCVRAGRRIGRADPDAGLAMAEEFVRSWHETAFLRGLATSLTETDAARAASVAEDIEGQEEREQVLRRIASELPADRADEALAIADRCHTRWIRCEIRAQLATKLGGVEDALARECLDAALDDWQRIRGPWQIARAAGPVARAVVAMAPEQADAVLQRYSPAERGWWEWLDALTVLAAIAPEEARACAEQGATEPPAGEEGFGAWLRSQFVGVIAGVDLQAGLGLAGAMDQGLIIQAAARAAQVDATAGRQLVQSLAEPEELGRMMAEVVETLIERDLKAARALVDSIENVNTWTSSSMAIATGLADTDPEAAAAMLETIAPRLGDAWARMAPLAFRLGLWDGERTAELVGLIASPMRQACAQAGLAAAVHESDPEAAQTLVQKVVQTLGGEGLGEAAGPIHDVSPFLVRVAPDAAFGLLDRLPDTQPPAGELLSLKLATLREMSEQVLRQRGAWVEEEE